MKTKLIIAIVALIVVLGGGYAWLASRPNDQTFTSEHITFAYPSSYEPQPVSEPAANNAQTIIRLRAIEPVRSIVLAYEKNAQTGANLSKQNFLDFLEKNAQQNFPRYYSGYVKDKVERLENSGVELSKLTFRYTGTDKQTPVYASFLIIPVGKDAYYLTLQSTDQKRLASEADRLYATLQILK